MISIVIPVYNAAKFLGECLSNIQRQTLNDFECLLVNDGSTDSSLEICKETAANDSRFKVVDQPNSGAAGARATGARAATRRYVCFIDADDIIHPEFLETLLAASNDCPPGHIVSSEICPYQDGERPAFSVSSGPNSRQDRLSALSSLLYQKSVNGVVAKLYPRVLISESDFRGDVVIGEDLIQNLESVKRAEGIVSEASRLYAYRLHASSSIRNASAESHVKLLCYLEEQKSELPELRNALDNRIFAESMFATLETDFMKNHKRGSSLTGKLISNIERTRKVVVKDPDSRYEYRLLAAASFVHPLLPRFLMTLRSSLRRSPGGI
ncbi:glycosyltransferase [Corynebacterium sp. zg912]|uniref:Glycosyltransferase family 2 protein n=1 Tax=Corynebacterium wankanglinii TaxID=2735136 RepID=A0A7V8UW11_9CORY|nr:MULTISPECIES: glycosyltransferase family A protein [Corynebacterium]MBA1838394.1 glycosyltransferase family 2 protein [Corynebacterium wankanglinii]MCR5929907.1 glycosyltransferase [Corynebacterium sp. zg912]